jgi:acetoin utilization deacetylase AcuC-like enzyme
MKRRQARAPDSPPEAAPFPVVHWPGHYVHRVHDSGYVERPARVTVLLESVLGLGLFRPVDMRPFADSHITAVHDRGMVRFMHQAAGEAAVKGAIYPYVFPIRHPERRPRDLDSCAGYYCIDTFTPLLPSALRAARAAVDVALTGADEIRKGQRLAYALCRPPGHHSERRVFGGFCYFNNAAIAAHFLSRQGRVATLDLDFHHGNGTQDIFYERSDVLTISIHGHPYYAYPHFAGFADERGSGEGTGFNHNFPLPEKADGALYVKTVEKAARVIAKAGVDYLVVSLGLDTMAGDQAGYFMVTSGTMREVGERVGALGLPTLVVQEGGYHLGHLGSGAAAFFSGFARAMPNSSEQRGKTVTE